MSRSYLDDREWPRLSPPPRNPPRHLWTEPSHHYSPPRPGHHPRSPSRRDDRSRSPQRPGHVHRLSQDSRLSPPRLGHQQSPQHRDDRRRSSPKTDHLSRSSLRGQQQATPGRERQASTNPERCRSPRDPDSSHRGRQPRAEEDKQRSDPERSASKTREESNRSPKQSIRQERRRSCDEEDQRGSHRGRQPREEAQHKADHEQHHRQSRGERHGRDRDRHTKGGDQRQGATRRQSPGTAHARDPYIPSRVFYNTASSEGRQQKRVRDVTPREKQRTSQAPKAPRLEDSTGVNQGRGGLPLAPREHHAGDQETKGQGGLPLTSGDHKIQGQASSSASAAATSECIIHSCRVPIIDQDDHLVDAHVPPCIGQFLAGDATPDVIQPCLFTINTIALWVLGRRYGTPEELIAVLTRSHPIPDGEFKTYSWDLSALCMAAGWEPITQADIPYGRGPASLLHPRWLALVLNYLSPSRRTLVADLFQERQSTSQNPAGNYTQGAEWLPLDNSTNLELQGAEWLPPAQTDVNCLPEPSFTVRLPVTDPPEAFDSHFHADRTYKKLSNGTLVTTPLEAVVNWNPVQQPVNPVKLVGGVTCYCDPEAWPEDFLSSLPSWKVSLGIHPRKVQHASPEFIKKFLRQCSDPGVSAIGEIGYDLLEGKHRLEEQHALLENVLGNTREGLPLVFHVRGRQGDDFSTELYTKLRTLVGRFRSPEQVIILHCFHGNISTVQTWLEFFPNTFFSVNGYCRKVNARQQEALLAIPRDHLLLETDSPYLSVTYNVRCNLPHYLGDVAHKLAEHLQLSPRELLSISTANGQRIFLQ